MPAEIPPSLVKLKDTARLTQVKMKFHLNFPPELRKLVLSISGEDSKAPCSSQCLWDHLISALTWIWATGSEAIGVMFQVKLGWGNAWACCPAGFSPSFSQDKRGSVESLIPSSPFISRSDSIMTWEGALTDPRCPSGSLTAGKEPQSLGHAPSPVLTISKLTR